MTANSAIIRRKLKTFTHNRKYIRLWVVFLLFSLGGLADIPNSNLMEGCEVVRWTLMTFIALFKATLLDTILYAFRRHKFMRTMIIAFIVVYCAFCLINFCSWWLYGFGITNKLMTIIAQTNSRELLEFLPIFADDFFREINPLIFLVLVILITCSIYFAPVLLIRKYSNQILFTAAIIGFLSFCYCLITFPVGKTTLLVSVRVTKNIYQSIDERKTIKKLEDCRKVFPFPEKIKSSHKANNIVFVIGESAARDHHSIYGYPLCTTPYLDSISKDLFIFQNAVASGTATALNMECLLSFKSDNDTTQRWFEFPWLIDLFKYAGYKTFWLSNQEKSGIWSNPSAIMVSDADEITYVGAESNSDHTLDKYDTALLQPFNQAICDSSLNKLICIHLLGSHIKYSKRYPPHADFIKADSILNHNNPQWMTREKAQTVAQYDNSIRFTDAILKNMIKSIRNKTAPSVLIYLSDHGEFVYDGRNFRGRDRSSVRVPFIIYINDAYRKYNPDIVKRLYNAEKSKFSTSDVIHLIMTLSGTSYPYYDESKDILSDWFKTRTRYVDNIPWEYECDE